MSLSCRRPSNHDLVVIDDRQEAYSKINPLVATLGSIRPIGMRIEKNPYVLKIGNRDLIVLKSLTG